MAGDELVPVHRHHGFQRVFPFERIGVDHAAAGKRSDRDEIDREQHLLLGQAHDHGVVGVVEADECQLERGVPERDRAMAVEDFVGHDRVRILDLGETLLRALERDDHRAGVLEGLAPGDVVEVMVAVNEVLDGLVGDFLDLADVSRPAGRPAVPDGVGRDHARRGDHEH
jgi:hypothetical protein